jgi:hypothetical protein
MLNAASLKISYLIIKIADQHQNRHAYPIPYIDLVSKVSLSSNQFSKNKLSSRFWFLSLHVLEAARLRFVEVGRLDLDGMACELEIFRLRLNTSRNSRFAHLVWTF